MLSTTKECALLRTCSLQLEATGKGTQSYLIRNLSFQGFVSQGTSIRVSQYGKAPLQQCNTLYTFFGGDI